MSDSSAMENAARQAARTGAGVAATAAAALALIIRILRERRTATPPAPRVDSPAVVQQNLPEVFPQLAGSPQWPQLMNALDRLGAAGVDVGQFLRWARPIVLHEHTQAQAAATQNRPAQASVRVPGPPAVSAGRGGGVLRGLARRVSDPSGTRARAEDLTVLGVLPPMEAWAVLAAYAGAGYEKATALIESRQWPQIALDLNVLGRAGGDPAGVLRQHLAVWNQQQARGMSGPDWPDTALVGLGSALQQQLPQQQDAAQTPQAAPTAQPGTSRAPDTAEVPTQTAGSGPAAPPAATPDVSPVFSDALDGLAGLDDAAVARDPGVAQGGAVHVVDTGHDEALSTDAASTHTASRGR